jgi:hypothetical protein
MPDQQLPGLNRIAGLRGALSARTVDFRNTRDERINTFCTKMRKTGRLNLLAALPILKLNAFFSLQYLLQERVAPAYVGYFRHVAIGACGRQAGGP